MANLSWGSAVAQLCQGLLRLATTGLEQTKDVSKTVAVAAQAGSDILPLGRNAGNLATFQLVQVRA